MTTPRPLPPIGTVGRRGVDSDASAVTDSPFTVHVMVWPPPNSGRYAAVCVPGCKIPGGAAGEGFATGFALTWLIAGCRLLADGLSYPNTATKRPFGSATTPSENRQIPSPPTSPPQVLRAWQRADAPTGNFKWNAATPP